MNSICLEVISSHAFRNLVLVFENPITPVFIAGYGADSILTTSVDATPRHFSILPRIIPPVETHSAKCVILISSGSGNIGVKSPATCVSASKKTVLSNGDKFAMQCVFAK